MITIADIVARLRAKQRELADSTMLKPPLDEPGKFGFFAGKYAGLDECIQELLAMERSLREDDDADPAAEPRKPIGQGKKS